MQHDICLEENIIQRAYYHGSNDKFLQSSEAEIYQEIVHNSMAFDLTYQQEEAWNEEIRILRDVVAGLGDCYIAFEYTIPRMGKRVDAIIIKNNFIFVVEFKVHERKYLQVAINQTLDYALDLHNFHELSHNATLIPVLVCTEANDCENEIVFRDDISSVVCCNENSFLKEIEKIISNHTPRRKITPAEWINSSYKPTPTIIEAAQALYAGHDVREISHRESDDNDIILTTSCIDDIIEKSRKNDWKSICFVTGVPGAGKTLIGLNIANRRHRFKQENEEHAVFLSGNEPLVSVLREALTLDKFEKKKQECAKCKSQNTNRECNSCEYNVTKNDIKSETKSFIQMIHWFRNDSLLEGHPAPIDKIAIFDEAQRVWKKEKLSKFMREKNGQRDYDMSEPECLIEYMNRHDDWAVIVCLVGGGQEIHDGEAGLTEWFRALNEKFSNWKVFCSDKLVENEYVGESCLEKLLSNVDFTKCKNLHLSVSMRSFRSELVSEFAKTVIDANKEGAYELYKKITELDQTTKKEKYPIFLTRDINKAKTWVKDISRGTERYGIIASSAAKRLRADGIMVPKDMEVEKWFLKGKDDINSSYFMEIAASEFKIQGLEIDYAIVAWEGDYRFNNGEFGFNKFEGSSWKKIRGREEQTYLKNSYRVLLTRARQGFVIYVPRGNLDDKTRLPEYYDQTYEYLKEIGIKEI